MKSRHTFQNCVTVVTESREFFAHEYVRDALRRVNAYQLTRHQFAALLSREIPWALVYVGGRHVAIHGKKSGERVALVTSLNSDWQ